MCELHHIAILLQDPTRIENVPIVRYNMQPVRIVSHNMQPVRIVKYTTIACSCCGVLYVACAYFDIHRQPVPIVRYNMQSVSSVVYNMQSVPIVVCLSGLPLASVLRRSLGLPAVSRFGLAVRRQAGKRKDLGSIPLRLSFLFKKVVVCGHCPVTLSITSY